MARRDEVRVRASPRTRTPPHQPASHHRRLAQVERRDGHLTKDQRVKRFQEVVGACGMDKECMRRVLGQTDAQEGDAVIF